MRILLTVFLFVTVGLVAQQPTIIVQQGHDLLPSAMTFSISGKYLITGGVDKQIKVWEANTGRLLRTIKTYEEVNSLLPYSLNDDYVFVGQNSRRFGIPLMHVNIATGERTVIAKGPSIKYMEAPTWQWLVTGHYDNYVRFWKLDSMITLSDSTYAPGLLRYGNDFEKYAWATAHSDTVDEGPWEVHVALFGDTNQIVYQCPMEVSHMAFFNGDKELAVETNAWSADTIYFYETERYRIINKVAGKNLCLSADKETIYYTTNSDDQHDIIRRMDRQGNPLPGTLESPFLVTVLSASPSGDKLAAMSFTGEMAVWDLKKGDILSTTESTTWREALAFDPTGKYLSFNGDQGKIITWNFETGQVKTSWPHTDQITHLAYSPNGKYLVSAARDSLVLLHDNEGDSIMGYVKFFGDNEVNSLTISKSFDFAAITYKDTLLTLEWNPPAMEKSTVNADLTYAAAVFHDSMYVNTYYKKYYTLFDPYTDSLHYVLEFPDYINSIAFSAGDTFMSFASYQDSVALVRVRTGEIVHYFPTYGDYPSAVAFSPRGDLISGHESGRIFIMDTKTMTQKKVLDVHEGEITEIAILPEQELMATASKEGKIILWNTRDYSQIASLFAFPDGTWAVVDTAGRYDASNAGIIPHLHFVLNNESIELYQLKERYYQPGLLQNLLGYAHNTLRDVSGFGEIEMYPLVQLNMEIDPLPVLSVTLTGRSGGYGKVGVYLNDKLIIENALPGEVSQSDSTVPFKIPLNSYSRLMLSDSLNIVSIKAFNEGGYLSSRYQDVYFHFEAPRRRKPKLYGIFIGTGIYAAKEMNLSFAADDAAALDNAMRSAAAELLGDDNVETYLFTTNLKDKSSWPTKANIQEAMQKIADEAYSNDVLILYLSGHGTVAGSNEKSFYYLTKDVQSGDLTDPAVRENFAISTAEISDWMQKIPANKQLLIIDACASGQVMDDLLALGKAVSPSQRIALEDLSERTGTFMLAGSAADQKSYEASQYCQGLLTYSLLQGMKGEALSEGGYVDINQLFTFAVNRTITLAQSIGSVQTPVFHPPRRTASIPIGRVNDHVNIEICDPKPVFTPSNLQESTLGYDMRGMGTKLDNALYELSQKGRFASINFTETRNRPDAYSISGNYWVTDGIINATLRIIFLPKGKSPVLKHTLEYSFDEATIDKVVEQMAQDAAQKVLELKIE